MELYLVQHGEAISKEDDREQLLTSKGKKDVKTMSQFLSGGGLEIDTIWHSTKKRAIETAEIIAKFLSPKNGIFEKEGLGPNDPIDRIIPDLVCEVGNLMIVGHLPFLEKLVSVVLMGSEFTKIFNFQAGGIVGLGQDQEDGSWFIRFAVIPDLFKVSKKVARKIIGGE